MSFKILIDLAYNLCTTNTEYSNVASSYRIINTHYNVLQLEATF